MLQIEEFILEIRNSKPQPDMLHLILENCPEKSLSFENTILFIICPFKIKQQSSQRAGIGH